MPHRRCREGDEVFVRAVVLEAASDAFRVRIEDHPVMTVTTWVPVSEVAKPEDIGALDRPRRAYYGKTPPI